MATIRDVVEALSRRAGVDAVVVVGRDGLPIASRTNDGVEAPPVPRHLLVVDDEPHIGLLLRPHLEELGYRVSIARNLAEARAALTAPCDGLLLDLHLPDGSGLDLLRELRSSQATRALPVIVLTAEGAEGVLAVAKSLDATLLTKPFSPTKLTARVAAMLVDAPRDGVAPPSACGRRSS